MNTERNEGWKKFESECRFCLRRDVLQLSMWDVMYEGRIMCRTCDYIREENPVLFDYLAQMIMSHMDKHEDNYNHEPYND